MMGTNCSLANGANAWQAEGKRSKSNPASHIVAVFAVFAAMM